MSANRGLESHGWQPIRMRHAPPPRGRSKMGCRRKKKTNICVLGLDTSCGYDPGLLFVLIKDMRISVDVTMDNSEPCLVGNAIPVSERRRTGIWVARHDMEWRADEGGTARRASVAGTCDDHTNKKTFREGSAASAQRKMIVTRNFRIWTMALSHMYHKSQI